MNFSLTFSDISLWLAVTAIIVLITAELLHSSPNISARTPINKQLLRLTGLGLGIAFLATVVMRALQIY